MFKNTVIQRKKIIGKGHSNHWEWQTDRKREKSNLPSLEMVAAGKMMKALFLGGNCKIKVIGLLME